MQRLQRWQEALVDLDGSRDVHDLHAGRTLLSSRFAECESAHESRQVE